MEAHRVGDITTSLRFSRKPAEGYGCHYDKVTAYVTMITRHAMDIDPGVTAQTFRIVEPSPNASPFLYADTATNRAGIAEITDRLKLGKVAIIGLGGTGSYILDFVAKSPIWEIHLFDGDQLVSHNAFRSPGAVSREELYERPDKVEHLIATYAKLRRGIVPHGDLDASNVHLLSEMDFAFLSLDRGKPKRLAVDKLVESRVPFVDVGMGLYMVEGESALGGTLRATLVTPDDPRMVSRIDMTDADGDDAYSTNIQIVELNAMNAAMAVTTWKRYFGFYKDLAPGRDSAYSVSCNSIDSGQGPGS